MEHHNTRIVVSSLLVIAAWGFWIGSPLVGVLFLVLVGMGVLEGSS